jgi:hypothetical protein
VNPDILKSPGAAKFLLRTRRPRKLLSLWESLARPSPRPALELLGPTIHGFEHLLLPARDRLIYDTRILHGGSIGDDLALHGIREGKDSSGSSADGRSRSSSSRTSA